jgi:hypothetical protein
MIETMLHKNPDAPDKKDPAYALIKIQSAYLAQNVLG